MGGRFATSAGGSMARFHAIESWSPLMDITGDALTGASRFIMPALYIAKLTFFAVVINRVVLKTGRQGETFEDVSRQAVNQLGLIALLYGAAVAVASAFDLIWRTAAIAPLADMGSLFSDATMFIVLVKLSLASPSTFRTGRLNLAESWRLTDGRFRAIFLTWFLALLAGLVIWLLVTLLHGSLDTLFGGKPVPDKVNQAASLQGLFAAGLLWILVQNALEALFWTMALAPLPAIYSAVTEGATATNPSTSADGLTPQALVLRRIGIGLMVFGWLGLVLVYTFLHVPPRWDDAVSNGLGWTGAGGLVLCRFARLVGRPRVAASGA